MDLEQIYLRQLSFLSLTKIRFCKSMNSSRGACRLTSRDFLRAGCEMRTQRVWFVPQENVAFSQKTKRKIRKTKRKTRIQLRNAIEFPRNLPKGVSENCELEKCIFRA